MFHESKFFKEGLALAPVFAFDPLGPAYRPLLVGRADAIACSSDRFGVLGSGGSTLALDREGECPTRSTGYTRGAAPKACGGERRAMLACISGGDMDVPKGRFGGACGEGSVDGPYGGPG
jgi:hypothetical protein